MVAVWEQLEVLGGIRLEYLVVRTAGKMQVARAACRHCAQCSSIIQTHVCMQGECVVFVSRHAFFFQAVLTVLTGHLRLNQGCLGLRHHTFQVRVIFVGPP